jgi:hypothetical protein
MKNFDFTCAGATPFTRNEVNAQKLEGYFLLEQTLWQEMMLGAQKLR